MQPFVHVVAGVVMDVAGRVLIAQRPAGGHLAGGWEFPGGKLEPGEDRRAGLARELHEELGIIVAGPLRPLMRVRHAYPSRDVLLDVWLVRQYENEPRGLDGQALRWCSLEELGGVELLPADGPIVRALRLPERVSEAASLVYSIAEWNPVRAAELQAGTHAALAPSVGAEGARLRGVLCATREEALAAWRAGADFLVMRNVVAAEELRALCEAALIPVYARGMAMHEAWAMGATGASDLSGPVD